MTFWKGGNFSIDDGETNPVLRRADDPTNATFLAHMTMGCVLQQERRGRARTREAA